MKSVIENKQIGQVWAGWRPQLSLPGELGLSHF